MPTMRVSQQVSRQLRATRKKGPPRGGIPALIILVVVCYALIMMMISLRVQGPLDLKPHLIRKSGFARSRQEIRRDMAHKPKGRFPAENDVVDRGDDAEANTSIHILFSTSCSDSQDWQSYLFFHQMMKMKQTGNVTRLVAGCTPEQEEHQREVLEKIQTTMSPRFNTYFIEQDFGKVFSKSGGDWHQYKYFNKPFGTKDFMENVLGYPDSHKHDDDLIVLMDPDMFLLRPFVNDFSGFVSETEEIHTVSHGHMFAQPFGFGTAWYREAEGNLTYLLNEETSPVYNMTMSDLQYYHAGPPYMGTGKDFYRLIKTWCDILPRYQDLRQHFMIEMYSASLAAAHLGLPFHLVSNFMISDHGVSKEGWSGIDSADPENLCTPSLVQDLPLVFHYCQRFGLGEYFFNKHIFAKNFNFFSCNEQLLKEPPTNVALAYNFSHFGDGSNQTWFNYIFVKRNAFMLCSMTSALNEAATFYKKHHCGKDANYSNTWMWHEANPQRRR